MCYLRILTSGYLQGNSQFFQEFVEGGRSMKEYCSQVTAHLSHNVYMFRQTVMHDCASILDVLLRRHLVPTIFRMVHPYIPIHSVE